MTCVVPVGGVPVAPLVQSVSQSVCQVECACARLTLPCTSTLAAHPSCDFRDVAANSLLSLHTAPLSPSHTWPVSHRPPPRLPHRLTLV